MGWGRWATAIGDILFSIVALFLLFRFFLKANALDLRFYILWGSVLGLFLYSRLLSRITVGLFLKLFYLIEKLMWLIKEGIKIPIKGIILMMQPPYAILRWFSLLVFRILENLFGDPLRLTQRKAKSFWDKLFPPRTNG